MWLLWSSACYCVDDTSPPLTVEVLFRAPLGFSPPGFLFMHGPIIITTLECLRWASWVRSVVRRAARLILLWTIITSPTASVGFDISRWKFTGGKTFTKFFKQGNNRRGATHTFYSVREMQKYWKHKVKVLRGLDGFQIMSFFYWH